MNRVIWVLGVMGLGLLGGCAVNAHGVRVNNLTDRIVRAELLLLRKDGEMTVYSTQTLGPGAEFKNMVDGEERRRGMRVRFTLTDQKLEDANWVMLNLPEKQDRLYDLLLVGGHLTAKEWKKGEKPTMPE